MVDPSELILTARLLAGDAPSSDARLRRAVSTAYYALFHKILQAASDHCMGIGQRASAGYALVYRSFDHRHMKDICEALSVPTLRTKFSRNLGRSSVSREIRDFSVAFRQLQANRHLADYDPNVRFSHADTVDLIGEATAAMEVFDRASAAERADVLALLMVKTRD